MWTFIVLLLIARYVISKNVVHSHRSASPTSMLPLKVANKLFWILTSWLFTPPKNNISNPFPQVVTFSCTIWHPQRWKQLKICQLKFLYVGRGSERPLRTWNSANHNLLGCSQSVSFFLFCFVLTYLQSTDPVDVLFQSHDLQVLCLTLWDDPRPNRTPPLAVQIHRTRYWPTASKWKHQHAMVQPCDTVELLN